MGTEGRAELRTVAIMIRRRDEIGTPEIPLFFCLSRHRSYRPIGENLGRGDALKPSSNPIEELSHPKEVQILVQLVLPRVHLIPDYSA
jgi:hypothetical protein